MRIQRERPFLDVDEPVDLVSRLVGACLQMLGDHHSEFTLISAKNFSASNRDLLYFPFQTSTTKMPEMFVDEALYVFRQNAVHFIE